ncbi:phosphoribosylformylglycinamidine cyclo-ligase [Desulfovibrio sp.]
MPKRTDAYKAAGVDVEAAGEFISRIKKMVSGTFTKGVVTDIGGFGGLFKLDLNNIQNPVLVSGTDGVGTKLKLAFQFDRHDTIGIDLVAMSVNDVLVQGAKPLFFLDYFATSKLDTERAVSVLSGVAEGCKQSGCALLGGETAEMPGFYAEGEYDLSGFCVGIVDDKRIVDGSTITIGDRILGLASSGLHSNGYSLARKLFDASGLKPADPFPGEENRTAAEVLLQPTRIYVQPVLNLLRDLTIKGMVHITGGGFYDNVPRVLPKGVAAHFTFGSWPVPPVFRWLMEQGKLDWPTMLQTFNCGVGYMLIVGKDMEEDVRNRLKGMDLEAHPIGEIVKAKSGQEQVLIDFPAGRC